MEPDLLQNSHVHYLNINEDIDFGPKFKKLRITDNVRELQTVIRDKWVCDLFLMFLTFARACCNQLH